MFGLKRLFNVLVTLLVALAPQAVSATASDWDENEHVKTMKACQDYSRLGRRVVSPHALSSAPAREKADRIERREQWKRWAEEVNSNRKY